MKNLDLERNNYAYGVNVLDGDNIIDEIHCDITSQSDHEATLGSLFSKIEDKYGYDLAVQVYDLYDEESCGIHVIINGEEHGYLGAGDLKTLNVQFHKGLHKYLVNISIKRPDNSTFGSIHNVSSIQDIYDCIEEAIKDESKDYETAAFVKDTLMIEKAIVA